MKINIPSLVPNEICLYCFGSGKLKAMQSAMTINGPSVRVNDIEITCDKCKGTGKK